MKIAVFDSGIGGLTVLKRIVAEIPGHEYIYYADTKHVPYGVKPKDEVREYVFEAVDFIAKMGIQALVIACNTATSVAIDDLRRKYGFPILGMEPALKPALLKNRGRKVLVTATSLTLSAAKLEGLIASIDHDHRVVKMELDRLVRFAEAFEFESDQVRQYLKERFADIHATDYEAIVLGCTHFVFFRELIQQQLGPDIEVIDGNAGTVKNLRHVLEEGCHDMAGSGKTCISFYSSGVEDSQERKKKLLEIVCGAAE